MLGNDGALLRQLTWVGGISCHWQMARQGFVFNLTWAVGMKLDWAKWLPKLLMGHMNIPPCFLTYVDLADASCQ